MATFIDAEIHVEAITAAMDDDAGFAYELWVELAERLHMGLLLDNACDIFSRDKPKATDVAVHFALLVELIRSRHCIDAPNTNDKTKGMYEKFRVERTDGKSAPGEKHHGCQYFVLDLNHDPYAIAALNTYADECHAEYPELARDIRATVNCEH